MIPVDSIAVPAQFMSLCTEWYGGQSCMLYAVASTGGVYLGTDCPVGCTDSGEKWYLTLWRDLSVDVMRARRSAVSAECDNSAELLGKFEDWVDGVCALLESSYDLADWEI